jgi:acetylglutamate kinase
MVKDGTISDGMLPKIHACLTALERGVGKAHIIDGRMSHSLLLNLFTDKGIGTEILSSVQVHAEDRSIQSLTSV